LVVGARQILEPGASMNQIIRLSERHFPEYAAAFLGNQANAETYRNQAENNADPCSLSLSMRAAIAAFAVYLTLPRFVLLDAIVCSLSSYLVEDASRCGIL
jgi:hypothetical protein